MPHVEKKPIRHYPWLARIIFWAQKLKYGKILEPAWIWGRSPRLLYAMQVYYRLLDRKNSPLSPALRALVSNRVSQLNHCAFCSDLSANALMKAGVSLEKIDELSDYENSAHFSPMEKAALRYSDKVTLAQKPLAKADLDEVKKYFTEDVIVELTAWIAFQNLSSKFNAALDIEAQGFCRLPGQRGSYPHP